MIKKICQPGEVIFREGDESTEAYWITSGRVEITLCADGVGLTVAQLGPGEIFGEMGLIGNRPRTATATALIPTELEVFTEEGFEKDVLQQPSRLRTYLGRLFERLRAADILLQSGRTQQQPPSVPVSAPAAHPPTAKDCCEPAIKMTSLQANPVTGETIVVNVDRFPFRIGRAQEQSSPFLQNDFSIPDAAPHQISRHHASIDIGRGKCFVSDFGSRLGTVVNGVKIGVGNGSVVEELKAGDNTVIFGKPDTTPHRYSINLSPGG